MVDWHVCVHTRGEREPYGLADLCIHACELLDDSLNESVLTKP